MTPRKFNRGITKRFENWVAEQMLAGYNVNLSVRPQYERNTRTGRTDPYPHALQIHVEVVNPQTGRRVGDYHRTYCSGA